MNKYTHSSYNIYQQKAIQTLRLLSQKYSEEILIQSLFSKSSDLDKEKDINKKLSELKKNVSLEDLSSFLFHIINGETYDTIIFSSELPSPLRVNQDLNETEENEKNDEESERTNKKNIIRIKLNDDSESIYQKKNNNSNGNNINLSNNSKSKKNELFNIKKSVYETNNIILNKPIIKISRTNNFEITHTKNKIRNHTDKRESKLNKTNKISSNLIEFTSISHKNQIILYHQLLKKLSWTHNLSYSEFSKFYSIRKKLNRLLKRKSSKRIRKNIYGLGIIGKHYIKNKKGEIYCYKPKSIQKGKIIEFICSEGDKCGSFGYYNILSKKFVVKTEHKIDFCQHKINKVKDRFFVRKLMKNNNLFDIQEYIKFIGYE